MKLLFTLCLECVQGRLFFFRCLAVPIARSIVRLASIHAAITAAEAQDLAVVLLATPSFHAPGS